MSHPTGDNQPDARIGMVFDDEYTEKLMRLCEYTSTAPYPFLVRCIDNMIDLMNKGED